MKPTKWNVVPTAHAGAKVITSLPLPALQDMENKVMKSRASGGDMERPPARTCFLCMQKAVQCRVCSVVVCASSWFLARFPLLAPVLGKHA